MAKDTYDLSTYSAGTADVAEIAEEMRKIFEAATTEDQAADALEELSKRTGGNVALMAEAFRLHLSISNEKVRRDLAIMRALDARFPQH
jgi:hypothetical protein